MNRMMRAGAFAKLCRTTKETLRHYDRMGLLCPVLREGNGYKMYTLAQIADFALISALKSAGMPLARVQEFLDKPGNPQLRNVLYEQIDAIKQQRIELERKQHVLEDALAQASELDTWIETPVEDLAPALKGSRGANAADLVDNGKTYVTPDGYRWRIRACPDTYYIETAVPYDEEHEDDFLAAVREHLDYCERHGLANTFQEAYRCDAEHVARGAYGEGYCAELRVEEAIDSKRLRVKPAGVYLQWLNRIDLAPYLGSETEKSNIDNPLFAAYDAMIAFAKDQGWHLTGDLFDSVLSLYSGNIADALYTEVSMRINLVQRGE